MCSRFPSTTGGMVGAVEKAAWLRRLHPFCSLLWLSGRTAGHAVVLHFPCSCRTAALVCNAMRAQRCGDDSNARIQLTKALKAAHTHLGNTQMVAQVGCAARPWASALAVVAVVACGLAALVCVTNPAAPSLGTRCWRDGMHPILASMPHSCLPWLAVCRCSTCWRPFRRATPTGLGRSRCSHHPPHWPR